LVGEGFTIYDSYATGRVTAGRKSFAGGLAGEGGGEGNFATGSVTAGSGSYVGGVGGIEDGPGNSYATGAVTGGDSSYVGGFAGLAYVSDSYSTGKAAGGTGSYVGGFAGELGNDASGAYWDTTTSGTNVGVGHGNNAGVTGLTTTQFQSGLPAGFSKKIWHEDPNINGGLPYLRANPPPS
jgi:hypothetical protein